MRVKIRIPKYRNTIRWWNFGWKRSGDCWVKYTPTSGEVRGLTFFPDSILEDNVTFSSTQALLEAIIYEEE